MEQRQLEILLIEDNHDEAELAINSLKKNHLVNHLVHLDDGAKALDFLFKRGKYATNGKLQRPKMILLDLKLPKVDGLEVLRQIKADEQLKIIPVVVLTSSKEQRDIVESYKLGVNSYITKPINFDSFVKAVSDLGLYWLVLNESPVTI